MSSSTTTPLKRSLSTSSADGANDGHDDVDLAVAAFGSYAQATAGSDGDSSASRQTSRGEEEMEVLDADNGDSDAAVSMSVSVDDTASTAAAAAAAAAAGKLGPAVKKAKVAACNNGGATFEVTDLTRLNRFLILGCEGGTYYQKQQELAEENAAAASRLLASGRGEEVLATVVDVSTNGRAAKQDPCLFVLAMCVKLGDDTTRAAAYAALARVVRIPTHLFSFLDFCEALSPGGKGWGRAHRRAISEWYTGKDPRRLAMLVTKYAQRDGWTHRDVLRLCHAKCNSGAINAVFRYITKGTLPGAKAETEAEAAPSGDDEALRDVVGFLAGVEACKHAETTEECISLVSSHGLVREHIPTLMLREVEVWRELLKGMPMTAMIRNLGKMSSIGLLDSGSPEEAHIVKQLGDVALLRRARVHPIQVLIALRTYSNGRGLKGKLTWTVNAAIKTALDQAFYKCFDAVQPTGKRYLHGIDVSGSMDYYQCCGTEALTPRDVACALSMVTARTEPLANNHFMAFAANAVRVDPSHTQGTLEEFISHCKTYNFGGTYCEMPMLYALQNRIEVDVFVVYTDCETAFSMEPPAAALKRYRQEMGIPDARLIVVATTSNGFSIADPDDPGMLDIAGFDPSVTSIITEFVNGKL